MRVLRFLQRFDGLEVKRVKLMKDLMNKYLISMRESPRVYYSRLDSLLKDASDINEDEETARFFKNIVREPPVRTHTHAHMLERGLQNADLCFPFRLCKNSNSKNSIPKSKIDERQ